MEKSDYFQGTSLPTIEAERVVIALKGTWRLLHFLFISSFMMLTAWAMYGNVFFGTHIPHHCKIPEGYILNESVPYVEQNGQLVPHKCLAYKNFSHLTNDTQPCPDGWTYEGDRHSIVDLWDLVCDNDYLVTTGQTVMVGGVLSGAFIMPIFADKFGRKTIMCLSMVSIATLGCITSAINNFNIFLVLRFFTGVFQQGVVLTNCVLRCEMFPISKRAMVTVFGFTTWSLGACVMALAAYYITNWRHLVLVYAVPGFIGIPVYCISPESPSWLVAKRRFMEVRKQVEASMKWNTRSTEEDKIMVESLLKDLVAAEKFSKESTHTTEDVKQMKEIEKASNYSMFDIFKSKKLVLWAMINLYLWCITTLVYYGLSFTSVSLVDNFHLGFVLSTIIELPTALTSILGLQFIGRRWTSFLFYLIAGLSVIIVTAIPNKYGSQASFISVIIFSLIGKFGIASTFECIFVWAQELFPTTVRNVGLGLASFGGRIGNICAPFSAYMAKKSPLVIGAIFGGMSLGACLLSLVLPETRGRKLPLTIEEAETWTHTISKEELDAFKRHQQHEKFKYKAQIM